jgi:hypothetical protein
MRVRKVRGDHPYVAPGLWVVEVDGLIVNVFATKRLAVDWMRYHR